MAPESLFPVPVALGSQAGQSRAATGSAFGWTDSQLFSSSSLFLLPEPKLTCKSTQKEEEEILGWMREGAQKRLYWIGEKRRRRRRKICAQTTCKTPKKLWWQKKNLGRAVVHSTLLSLVSLIKKRIVGIPRNALFFISSSTDLIKSKGHSSQSNS